MMRAELLEKIAHRNLLSIKQKCSTTLGGKVCSLRKCVCLVALLVMCSLTLQLVLVVGNRSRSSSSSNNSNNRDNNFNIVRGKPIMKHTLSNARIPETVAPAVDFISSELNRNSVGDKRTKWRIEQSSTVRALATAATETAVASETLQQQLLEKIRRASDPRLYAKLQIKLRSLSSIDSVKDALSTAVDRCSNNEGRLQYVQSYAYVHEAAGVCLGEQLALVAVHSNAKYVERRAAIRRTWASLRYVGRYRMEVAFFLGRPAGADATPELQARIDAESRRHGDVVQLDFAESYRNLTVKHLAVYEWSLTRCRSARFLVKVDDDTFVNFAHLATFLSSAGTPDPLGGFYCSATRGAKPQRVARGPKAKWVVSKREFAHRVYPTYCEGFGYTLHSDRLSQLYLCSLFRPFFWIDDVHVTGSLAAAAGVPVTAFRRGHGFATLVPSLASEAIMDYLFITPTWSEFFHGLWHRLWHAVLTHSLDTNL